MSDRSPQVPPPMLETLLRDTLDPGYERAARSRAAGTATGSPRSATAWLVTGTVLVGLLLAVAFVNTKANAGDTDAARLALANDVARAQEAESALASSAGALADAVRSAQSGGDGRAYLNGLEQMNALIAVSGPGLSITLDDPQAASGNGAIFDTDLQLLVNGLWASGAEAIAVGGVRLRVTSAVRHAGGAILVDNRPVLWPMTIDAIGDPDTIHQAFISTDGFRRFNTFVQLYDITFTVLAADQLTLPAAAAVDAHYAGDTTTTTDAPAPTGVPATGTASPGTVTTATGTTSTVTTATVTTATVTTSTVTTSTVTTSGTTR